MKGMGDIMKQKRWIGYIFILSLFIAFKFDVAMANTVNNGTIINIEEAEKTACLQVDCMLQSQQNKGKWTSDVVVSARRKLYDSNNNVTAYCISFSNSLDEDCGYVVVGANKNDPPIIEYSTSGEFFTEKGQKTYYFGGYEYYIEKEKNSSVLKNVSNPKTKYVMKKEMQDGEEETNEDYTDEWGIYRNGLLKEKVKKTIVRIKESNLAEKGDYNRQVSGSNPPNYDVAIENPFLYESGWISVAPIDVTNYWRDYYTTSQFVGHRDHCAPTAATNLMLYWYYRNISKYGKVRYHNSWSETFLNLYNYMKTNVSGTGTDESNIRSGIKKYLSLCGYSNSVVKNNYYPDFNDVVNELDNGYGGRPFIYCVYDHKRYVDHAMLALGYAEFEYSSKQSKTKSRYSRYIRVADGWDDYPNRFVHFKVGHESSQQGMITVHIAS